MDREAKRKAASNATLDHEGRAAKRQKLPGDADPVIETVETTTTVGLKFVDSLKAAKDKTGRPIATHFLTLPDKNVLPVYYEEILLPVAIDTIENKLKAGQYSSLAQVEGDLKRLVHNAKTFNDRKSLIYDDAERVRKTASNFMVKHNPAYRDPGYIAVPTPIPEHLVKEKEKENGVTGSAVKPAAGVHDSADRSRRAAPAQHTPAPKNLRATSRSAVTEVDNADYNNKSFQQAQEQIVEQLIHYTEADLQIFQPFINLPNRSLKDYYQTIKTPMSLMGVKKKVQGVRGREPATGFTDLKSWKAFEDEMSLIWRNAKAYNEDGSDIFNLAVEFEEIFRQRLAEAKSKVEEPPQPKLKINMSAPKQQSIKLRIGGLKGSPAPGTPTPDTPAGRSSGTPGVIVDSGALERQRSHVQASMNGQRPTSSETPSQIQGPRNPFGGGRSGSGSIPPLSGDASYGAAASPGLNGVKTETYHAQSPALDSIRLSSAAPEVQNLRLGVPVHTPLGGSVMPPPQHITPRPASGSPLPYPHMGQSVGYNPQNYTTQPPPVFENHARAAGKVGSDALLPSIQLNTHPLLSQHKPWSHFIPASRDSTQQSLTLTLPAAYHYLQVVPHIPVATTSRLYRLFVTVNNTRMLEVTRQDGQKEKGRPVFEAKLVQGVNRIEVEAVAEKEKEKKSDGKGEVEGEKCTIFVHLMRP
ncbi:Bromodomain-containing protein [Mytilinidion resinicola]|uniref:Bromodomain-containing protein n=1 Tax=Mytilinidion resinicola TaxID=574789 RepID=A0A6A6YC24_9PEZI|nr:Bromodomain-containing protein [Mytilinidion resinicola]KAF2806063.1 Bromodomain-containing protein [Mytilinidion resinicola]